MSEDSQRLADILRAESNGNDISEDDQGNILVLAETKEGKFYKVGHVTRDLFFSSRENAWKAISRIKFTPPPKLYRQYKGNQPESVSETL